MHLKMQKFQQSWIRKAEKLIQPAQQKQIISSFFWFLVKELIDADLLGNHCVFCSYLF